jgi:DNA-binding transcriptional regulator YiaG
MARKVQVKAVLKRKASASARRSIAGPTHRTLTARLAVVQLAPEFGRDRILSIRRRLKLSQPVFAAALNVSPETVKAWEQGKRAPDGAALRLLQLADKRPQWILDAVSNSMNSRKPSNGNPSRA